MSVLFTFPGKIGDALHQWPVAKAWADEHEQKIEVGLAASLRPLRKLIESQPCVERVHLLPGIKNYDIGGQPWDFGWGGDTKQWDQVFHLGLREQPARALTTEAYFTLDVSLSRAPLAKILSEPSITPAWSWSDDPPLLMLHGTKTRPHFYKTLIKSLGLLKKTFGKNIMWAGNPDEWPWRQDLRGQGLPLEVIAAKMSRCALVLGASSGIVALANTLKAPCIRIGEPNLKPSVVWENAGPRQYNIEPEEDVLATLSAILESQPWRKPSEVLSIS